MMKAPRRDAFRRCPTVTQPRRWSAAALHSALLGRLVVSCQPVDGGAMDDDAVVVRMAQAAVAGGAAALRIEGAHRLALVRQRVTVPLVGIVKRDLAGSPIRITPWLDDVQALLAAGADVVAVDATARPRPVPVDVLQQAIQGGVIEGTRLVWSPGMETWQPAGQQDEFAFYFAPPPLPAA